MRYSPFDVIAAHPHWTLAFVRLPDGEHGRWYDELQVMMLDQRLGRVGRRSTAAHEVEHALAGDRACVGTPCDDWFQQQVERRVDVAAARKLLDLDGLAEVLRWALDPREVAEEFDVETSVVRTRLRHLSDVEKDYIERRLASVEDRGIA